MMAGTPTTMVTGTDTAIAHIMSVATTGASTTIAGMSAGIAVGIAVKTGVRIVVIEETIDVDGGMVASTTAIRAEI